MFCFIIERVKLFIFLQFQSIYKKKRTMGACASSQQKKEPIVLDTFDQQPQDTKSLKDIPLPILLFSAQLTKIKVKRCIYPSISMKFSITDVEEFMLPQKDVVSQIARWDVEHVFRFQMTEYQMRKRFLILTLYDKMGLEIGILKINLYLLASGPFHQDFSIILKDDPSARVSFNLKIAQIIKMKFQFIEAEMKPIEKQYPGDKFTFSVRSIMGNATQYTSQSYIISVAFDEQDNQKPKLKSQSNIGSDKTINSKPKSQIHKNIISNQDSKHQEIQVQKNHLIWSKLKSNQMPSFHTELPLFELHSSAIDIIYWDMNVEENKDKDNIKSQCFVSINRLLNFQSHIIMDESNIPFQERIVELEQKNWSHGTQVGTTNFKMKFLIQKHLKQMQVCVRTEQGILKSSPVFSGEQNKMAVNKQIANLTQISAKIDQQFIELAKVRKEDGSTLQIRRHIENIIKLLNEEREIMKMTVKQSILFFNYKDQKDLLKGQQILIEIGFKTKAFIHQNLDEITSTCFYLLCALMKRGEFNLAHLGFNLQAISSAHDLSSPHQFKSKKIYIALKYQQLLNQLLSITLFSLNFKGHESQKQFAELFCAIAYFRIPGFRKHVLKAIERADDPQIQQWRGTEFNLYDKGDSRLVFTAGEEKNTYEILFDWENSFYKYIEGEQKYKKNITELQQLLTQNEWEQRIKKRKGAFYSFVQYWCDYVDTIAVNSKHLKWKHFPGYNRILHAFLVEMKTENITDYTDRMQKACASLLNNEKLLNTFVVILFKKSDVNDPNSILKLLDLLEMFFAAINKKNRAIPTTFDYTFFFKGLKMIIEGPHCYSLGKALIILYNHFNIFSSEFKYAVSLYLMGKLFFRLFLHWSFNVRTIFHHLLYIRINKMTEFSGKNNKVFSRHERLELRSRYDKLMIILQNANELKKKEDKPDQMRYEKELFKRMKKKLYAQKTKQKKVVEDNQSDTASMSIKTLAYNPRKNSVNDERLIQELARPKLERYNSEMMNQSLKIAIEQAQQKRDEIIPIRTNTLASELNDNDISASRGDSTQNKEIKKVTMLTEEEGEIWQMTKNQSQYLSTSLKEYGSIHDLFLKHITKNNNPESVPVVKLQIALDYEDIRPQKKDDW